MAWRSRSGEPVPGDDGQDRLLEWMYGTAPGQLLVRILIRPRVSELAGRLLDSRLSAAFIGPFRKKAGIDMADYEDRKYLSFNDFFTRRIREGKRPVDPDPTHLIAPCDSKLTVYPIGEDSRFLIKGTEYTLEALLKDTLLAKRFYGGTLLLFRLTVGDYHRYSYIDSGYVGPTRRIPGVYHTVNPAAASRLAVYKENTREYALLQTPQFGNILQMEVGATMVGRIVNAPGDRMVRRGEEKGRFEFGGSTVIVCLEKDAAIMDPDLLKNTREDTETVVRLGEKIGISQKGESHEDIHP